jgi:vitamin B12 transporter
MNSKFLRAARLHSPAHARFFALTALTLVASLGHDAALAQSAAANRLDSVVVTASRSPLKLSEVLADLTVITRAEIERQAFGTIADLLRNNGCVEMVRNGGPASSTSLYLRGADTRHTVVLVDGVRVDSQATGGASWNAIPLAQIERVEVLRGPASAIYGSDAVGGVVQIFTRKGDKRLALELGAGAGSLGTRKLDAAIFGASGAIDFALSVATERSDGFNSTLDLPGSFSYVPDRDGWRGRNASLRLGLQASAEQRLELIALKSHLDGQYDASKSRPLADDHSIQDTEAARLSWSAQWSPALQTQLSVGESKEAYETRPSPYRTETRIRNLALNGSYALGQGQQLNFIVERREDRLDNSGLVLSMGVDERAQNALALGYLMSSGPLSLQVHGRHDEDSQFGGVDTGTLMAGYELSPGLRIVGSTGTAFRAPTLYQRGSAYGPVLSRPGVSALRPERGRNVEFGLKYQNGASELGATAYRNEIRELIIFGAAGSCSSGFGCFQNVAKARLQGLSLHGATRWGAVNLSATLDLQAPKDAATGKLLSRRAKRHGSLRADTELAGWTLGAGVQASGRRYDDAANKRPLGGYALLNLDAQYPISKQLRLQINLDNSLDKAYQTAGGFATAPRTLFVGLRYSPAL